MTDSPTIDCPFCSLPLARIVGSNDHALAIVEGFPVSPGHMLIISRRHVSDFFDLTDTELAAMITLLRAMRNRLQEDLAPEEASGHTEFFLLSRTLHGSRPDPSLCVNHSGSGIRGCGPLFHGQRAVWLRRIGLRT